MESQKNAKLVPLYKQNNTLQKKKSKHPFKLRNNNNNIIWEACMNGEGREP